MNKNLIIDVGMHRAEDTDYYLKKGYNVIAIDADPQLINLASIKYKNYIDTQHLKLLNFAISDKDDEKVNFNLGDKSAWNSLNPNITNRENQLNNSVSVKTKKLSTILQNYGVPYYCKIDIEGYDNVALATLKDLKEIPNYISVETECIGKNEKISETEALATLNTLHSLGYKYFKLVEQVSLTVLSEDVFYNGTKMFFYKFFSKYNLPVGNRRKLYKKLNYKFANGATGPFGDDLEGTWMNYDQATNILLKQRKDYFNMKGSVNYGFWCDWHAKP
jgi:FkbM family methyltransferase